MKEQIKSVVALVAICAVVAVLLACTNYLTAPIIKENEASATNDALSEVLPDGKDFKEIDLSAYELPKTVVQAFGESGGGYVLKMETTGFSAGLVVMCGIGADGTVVSVTCLASNETNGAEKNYGEKFAGINSDSVDSVDLIGGSTKTTTAYRDAVKDALNAFKVLKGESVDLRTEEEILRDHLKEALPAGGEAFTKVFLLEVLDGVDAVYTADNGAGSVYVCDDVYVGVDAEGKAVSTGISEDLVVLVEKQARKLADITLTELDLTKYDGINKNVLKASVTSGGNYVIDVRGAGFGINGEEYGNPSGEYIHIRVVATGEGKIVNCITLSQKESEGFGSACADNKFYSQFIGKDQSDYSKIDAISGATWTTEGYIKAVGRALDAAKILKGDGANEE